MTVLVFVEDPGAANFVAGLPDAMSRLAIRTTIVATDHARPYLANRPSRDVVEIDQANPDELLARFRPALVVVGTSANPDSAGLTLVRSCAERGIPTVGVIDSPESSAYRFRGRTDDPLASAPDWLFVPDRSTAGLYENLGYPAARTVVCGHPHFDYVRETGAQLADRREALRRSLYSDAPADRRILLFAAEQPPAVDPGEYRSSAGYTLTGRGQATGRTEVVIEEFLDAVATQDPRPFCVLRVHPKNDPGDFSRYLDEFQQISQSEPALEMIIGSDGVVGSTTMLLVEAVLLGRPTLSIVPRTLECSWLSTIQLGLTDCVTTREQVRTRVARLVSDSPLPSPDKVAELLPSGATARAADVVRRLVASTPISARAKRPATGSA